MAGRWDSSRASAATSVSSHGSMGLRVGSDWWVCCHTYPDVKPILALVAGGVHLSVTGADHQGAVTSADLAFAREVVSATQNYLTALEDLHARASDSDEEPGAA